MRLLAWPALLALLASCVGDDPNHAATGNLVDAGADAAADASTLPPVEGGAAQPSLVADPVDVVQGTAGELVVHVTARDSMPTALTFQIQGAPAGLVPGTPALLAVGQTEITLGFSAAADAKFGPATVQVVATGAGLQNPLTATASIYVRGVRGALDTSYGQAGISVPPPSSILKDATITANGVLAVGLGPAVAVSYDADGAVAGQPIELPLQAGAAQWTELGRFDTTVDELGAVPGFVRRSTESSSFFSRASFAADAGATLTPPAVPSGPRNRLGNEAVTTLYAGHLFFDVTNSFSPNGTTYVNAFIRAYDEDTKLATAWGDGGALAFEPVDGRHTIQELRAGGGKAFVVGKNVLQAPPSPDTDRYDVRVVDLATATVTRQVVGTDQPPKVPARKYGLTEVAADGSAVLIRSGSSMPCLMRFHADGTASASAACNVQTGADERPSGGVILADDRVAVVALGATSTLWVSDAAGLVGAGSTLAELTASPTARVVRVFELSHERVLVLTQDPGPGGSAWSIRCFWL